jgi:hypothetical protein
MPKEMVGVGVDEHLGVQLPLHLDFLGSDGSPIRL